MSFGVASFKILVHFIYVIKFVGKEWFLIFFYYPFYAHKISSHDFSFISDISVYVFSLVYLVSLAGSESRAKLGAEYSKKFLLDTDNSYSQFSKEVFIFIFYSILFLPPHLWHVKIPRLGVESELQLQAYTAAMATLNLSHVCDLYHTLWQCQVLNPLSKARD